MEFTSAMQKLGAYQPRPNEKSKRFLETAPKVLAGLSGSKKDPETWDVLEKLYLASLDEGNMDIANDALTAFTQQFPDSSRVDCLQGIMIEVKQSPDVALEYYDTLLKADSSNSAAWRRKAGVYKKMGKIDKAVDELSAMLDTFYTEVEGWLELADIYTSCHQYEHCLQALSHVLLLAPQNPFHVVYFAETAYLVPDITLALKMFLQAVDMTDEEEQDGVAPSDTVPTGLVVRAWLGVKLCTYKLTTEHRAAANSPSQTPPPTTTDLASLDDLATERLRTAYLEATRESPPSGDKALMEAVAKTLV
ncbi:hypothetical protein NM688_g286 [Phlebia brevispora]|uniref:Uncharacterized protein n=1 Tax=Phlebia brevispora TaxID=194682 RepID=A0ACC1TEU1_9APHY|nr:hypothetical protein NM688_g286 [Phlebia brevispora]